MTVNTPTDHPKSVRNRCVIEVFGGFLCCPLVFEFSVGIGVFVISLSQIFFFSSYTSSEIEPYVWYWFLIIICIKFMSLLCAFSKNICAYCISWTLRQTICWHWAKYRSLFAAPCSDVTEFLVCTKFKLHIFGYTTFWRYKISSMESTISWNMWRITTKDHHDRHESFIFRKYSSIFYLDYQSL